MTAAADTGAFPIGGLEKCSFVDFPGTLAAVVFTRGCNLRCRYCHNPQLLSAARSAPDIALSEVLTFLQSRVGLLQGVAVTGGEPLLHAGLSDFLSEARRLGMRLKLDTNGMFPDRLEQLLSSKARPDYVALDFKDVPEGYAFLCGAESGAPALESLRVLRKSGVPFEVRTTVCAPLHSADRLSRMAEFLAPGEKWFLQCFRSGEILCRDAGFQPPDAGWLKELADSFRAERQLNCRVR